MDIVTRYAMDKAKPVEMKLHSSAHPTISIMNKSLLKQDIHVVNVIVVLDISHRVVSGYDWLTLLCLFLLFSLLWYRLLALSERLKPMQRLSC